MRERTPLDRAMRDAAMISTTNPVIIEYARKQFEPVLINLYDGLNWWQRRTFTLRKLIDAVHELD